MPDETARSSTGPRRRVVIMGAAGRDFHNFNTRFRNDPGCEVVAFTAAQIPGIEGRHYPPVLAGPLYPEGVPIEPEDDLERICRRSQVDTVVFAYSDVTHGHVMHAASRALAAGAGFTLLGPRDTMLDAAVPVIAVSAVRTGCGKSQTSRWIAQRLTQRGIRAAALRHPMPYGDLREQAVQRFASRDDLERAACTNEEREEFEPYIESGHIVYAGVDYRAILDRAQQEAEVIVWDGGNNDFPFVAPDLHVVLVDALRPDQLTTHHPGEAVLRMADVVVVGKTDAASAESVQDAIDGAQAVNPGATIVRARSPVTLDRPESVAGRRALVIEDGPTITHGGMPHGAGMAAALAAEVAEVVDPRPFASPSIRSSFEAHPHIGPVLPAVGYSREQLVDLERTINDTEADIVIAATPIDLAALVTTDKPIVRARYSYAEAGDPSLGAIVDGFLARLPRKARHADRRRARR